MINEQPWPLFDPRILNEFDSYLDGQEGELLSTELSEIFFSRGPELAGRLLSSFESEAHQELSFAAHSLKSSADNVGLIRLARLCEELEAAGKKSLAFEQLKDKKEAVLPLLEESLKALQAHTGRTH